MRLAHDGVLRHLQAPADFGGQMTFGPELPQGGGLFVGPF
jgi:hypothetical protein